MFYIYFFCGTLGPTSNLILIFLHILFLLQTSATLSCALFLLLVRHLELVVNLMACMVSLHM